MIEKRKGSGDRQVGKGDGRVMKEQKTSMLGRGLKGSAFSSYAAPALSCEDHTALLRGSVVLERGRTGAFGGTDCGCANLLRNRNMPPAAMDLPQQPSISKSFRPTHQHLPAYLACPVPCPHAPPPLLFPYPALRSAALPQFSNEQALLSAVARRCRPPLSPANTPMLHCTCATASRARSIRCSCSGARPS